MPSYASDAFLEETARWFRAVGRQLAPLRWPDGPIVLVQIDNEGALYFRDGAYDQDYHPDAFASSAPSCAHKYGTRGALCAKRGAAEDDLAFATDRAAPALRRAQAPPTSRATSTGPSSTSTCSRRAMERMARGARRRGLRRRSRRRTTFPSARRRRRSTPARIARVVDLVGLDYYHRATPAEHTTILRAARRELACALRGARACPPSVPRWAPASRRSSPPLDEHDSIYTLLRALAYGLRGFNLYMAVERDRWIGAPIDATGGRGPSPRSGGGSCEALERVAFRTLRRPAPVRVLTPRSSGSRA